MSITEQLIAKIKNLPPEAQAEVLEFVEKIPSRRPWTERLLALADEAAARNVELPADLAENHDHYIHGTSEK